jgi:hypothetical protein
MALMRIDSSNEPLHEHHRRSKQYSRNEPSNQPVSHSATVLNQLKYHGNADTNPQHEFEYEPHHLLVTSLERCTLNTLVPLFAIIFVRAQAGLTRIQHAIGTGERLFILSTHITLKSRFSHGTLDVMFARLSARRCDIFMACHEHICLPCDTRQPA